MTRMVPCFALAAIHLPLGPAFAENAAAKSKPSVIVPLPPARPVEPAAVGPAMGSSPLAPPVPAPPIPAGVPPLQPRKLPPASRAQMHACALEWQNMKSSGAAVDKTWLDFALVCLTK